jgi:ankyrin repeat protein
LLARGASAGAANARGETPLHFAAMHGSVRTVGALLEAGAPAAPVDVEGHRPLDRARAYAGRDLAAALRAEALAYVRDRGLPLRVVVRRVRREGDEPRVVVRASERRGGGMIWEKCDAFDATAAALGADRVP